MNVFEGKLGKVAGVLALSSGLVACGSDSDSESKGSVSQGSCLSDQEICQFTQGVSTREEIQSKLGNAQQYVGAEAAIYVCQQVEGQQIIHNDLVTFSFDSTGKLLNTLVIRQGSGATPPPNCTKK